MQALWTELSLSERTGVLRAARHRLAAHAEELADAISPHLSRTRADTLVSEVLPLLDACKFLEREAKRILAPRKLGRHGRPLWLTGVAAELHREPLGHVLVIGPSNFPLFLPGVQVLQALTAGNTVTWKPGRGGLGVAQLVARILRESGLPSAALTITGESVRAAQDAMDAKPDKIVFTGSSENGVNLLHRLADTITPSVIELSGADAIIVTPSADLNAVAKAVAFGLRLNGGAVCMSPRRLFAEPAVMSRLRPLLDAELTSVPAVPLDASTSERLGAMLHEAVQAGALLRGVFAPESQRPIVVDRAAPGMRIARSDVFAPVISLIEVASMLHLPEAYATCEYALTASIFCGRNDEKEARMLARSLKAGTVCINDAIAPTADPRVPFGGRGRSGYGMTRGAEGLLEMTAVKTLIVRRGGSMRHLEPTRDADTAMFAALIQSIHGQAGSGRWTALRRALKLARIQPR
jgi:aldehyde dehydrogenase (NAD+)